MATDIAGNVRKIFSIQEQRQAQYTNLKKAQEKYISQEWTLQQYQSTMSEVTTLFKSLSQEVLRLTGTFEDTGLKEVVCILKELQQVEMEKLELLVKWQLMSRQEDSEEEVEDFGAALHQKRELKKKLASVENSIAELMQDLRYECESFLVSTS